MFLDKSSVSKWIISDDSGYWTAWTTTQTTLASQWGLLINIDSATGDIARTTTGYIENEMYWAYLSASTATCSAEFDSASPMTGRLKVSLTSSVNAAWFPAILSSPSTAAATWNVAEMYKHGIPMKASTKYRFKVKIQWNTSGGTGVSVSYATYTTAWNRVTDYPNVYSGTLDQWSTTEFTTWGTVAFLRYWFFFLAWTTWVLNIDYNSMTLEEVVEPVANSLVTPSPSLVSLTAVGSTDNIDQSLDPTFVAVNTYTPPVAISETATNKQTFVPTKSKLTRIWIYPVAKGTWNWTVTVHDASNVVQAVITIANASLTNGVVTYFNVPANVTALASYHFHVTSTVADWTVRVWTASDLETCSYIQNYYKPTTNFKASQNNLSVSISADEDGFLNGSVINLQTWTATFTETFGTFYLLKYTVSGSDLIAEVNLPWVGLAWNFTSDRTLEYSSDWITYGSTFPTGFTKVWVKILAYSGFASFSYSIQFSTSGLSILKNYPTNKDIIKQYSTTLGAATTTATYRATKWGFPAIEYSSTEYQYLDIDTTATGSTVAFSELWTSYTTVADWASLAISSTSTPNIFVKANITANRLYLSSNDYNANSDKDWSMKETVVYQVVQ